jgi:hypothetical protein
MWVVLKEMRPTDNYISVAREIHSTGREKKKCMHGSNSYQLE